MFAVVDLWHMLEDMNQIRQRGKSQCVPIGLSLQQNTQSASCSVAHEQCSVHNKLQFMLTRQPFEGACRPGSAKLIGSQLLSPPAVWLTDGLKGHQACLSAGVTQS
ncbi:hypothetical protein NQZ68_013867 [Dissostichus eleginoides]|nr:hypothetical protein NQZ68_013867 [Dissostichus eleginoides]